MRGSSHRPVAAARFTLIQLFGRLAPLLSLKGSSGARLASSGGTLAPTGLCNKQGKKRSAPRPDHTFPRHGSRLHLNEGQLVSRPNKCHQIMRASVPAGTVSLVPVLPKAAGHDGISRNRSPSGDVAHTAFIDMISISETQFSQGQCW